MSLAKHNNHSTMDADTPGHPGKRQSEHLSERRIERRACAAYILFCASQHRGHDKEPFATTAH